MGITIETLRLWFRQFNTDYFDGELPEPRLVLSRSRTRLGSMSCRRKIVSGNRMSFSLNSERSVGRGNTQGGGGSIFSKLARRISLSNPQSPILEKSCDYSIHISTYYDCAERDFQNVLLHEMIHLHIAHKELRDTSSHGVIFRRMMNELNAQYGWNICVSTSTKGWKTTDEPTKKIRLVLAIALKDGKHFLSVVNPRYYRTLNQQLLRVKEVQSATWFTTDDNFFHGYSAVRSLRGKSVNAAVFEEKTREMTPFEPTSAPKS